MRYTVTISSADPNVPGLNLSVQVEAPDAISALSAAEPALQKTIDAIVGQLKPA